MEKIYKQLDRLGYPARLTGTGYLAEAVRIVSDDRRALMCKDVYPAIAAAAGVRASAVERNIRTATAAAIRSEVWSSEWRSIGGTPKTPCSSEVAHRLARILANEN